LTTAFWFRSGSRLERPFNRVHCPAAARLRRGPRGRIRRWSAGPRWLGFREGCRARHRTRGGVVDGMWTAEQRETYRRDGGEFPSNLTDAEWDRLEPLIPAAKPGGRPRKTEMRAAMNAILYLLRTGCPWRYLPRDGLPPRPTVYTSSASSSARASGRRSGRNFMPLCASVSAALPARARACWTARRRRLADAGCDPLCRYSGSQDRDGAALVLNRLRRYRFYPDRTQAVRKAMTPF